MDRESTADRVADLIQSVWALREDCRASPDPVIAGLTRDLDRMMDELAAIEVLLRHGAQAPGPPEGH